MEQQQQQSDHEESTESWFDHLSKNIHSNGGYVHPRIHFCQRQRQLILLPENGGPIGAGGSSDDLLPPSTTLFRIPQRSLITYNVAVQICPWLLLEEDQEEETRNSTEHSYHFPYEDLAIAVALATCLENEEKNEKMDSDILKNEDERQIDLSQQKQQQLECRRLVKLYLQSLPRSFSTSVSSTSVSASSSYYDAVPRRWSCNTINELLGGSSIVERIQASKVHVRQDYDLLKEQFQSWKKKKKGNNNTDATVFPPLELFDDMLVAVSSRAFQLSLVDSGDDTSSKSTTRQTTATNIAMVPILDLSDHCRGNRQSNEKKNVSYKLVSKPTLRGTSSSFSDSVVGEDATASSSSAMFLEVASTETLSTGQPLRLTYGAQGNQQLLVNYGFCIRDNVEPDGSSNDVLEFKLPAGKKTMKTRTVSRKRKITNDSTAPTNQDQRETTTVSLRMGPKSYTYGSFVKALEWFFPRRDDDDDDNDEMMMTCNSSMRKRCDGEDSTSKNDQDGMDLFLNSCENEEEDEDEYCENGGNFDDLMYGEIATLHFAKEEQIDIDEEDEEKLNIEIEALNKLRQELVAAIESYSLCRVPLQKGLDMDKPSSCQDSRRHFAAILCSSEINTLCFFIIAIDKLLVKLDVAKEEEKKLGGSPKNIFDPEQLHIVEKQTDELATSYMMIRHS